MSDLRETIKAAMEGGEPVAAEPEAQQPVAAEAAEIATPEVETPDDGAATRDEKGRFKAKAEAPAEAAAEAEPEVSEPASPEEPEPPKEAIRVPPHLPAALKAEYVNLPEAWREFIAKSEEGVQSAKAEWGRKGERLNRYDEIIAPHRDAWAMQGMDDVQALTRLVAAEKALRENPAQAFPYLAQLYGVDLQQIAPQTNGYSAPQAQTGYPPAALNGMSLDPALQPILSVVQDLQGRLEQYETNASAQQVSQAQKQIEAFAADPANLYFENVREDVATLLETGRAETLEDAYQKAIWANPEIRPFLLKEETRKAEEAAKEAARKAKAEADARAKSQAAQRASGSVTGAPTPGAQAPRQGSTGNLREDLMAAFNEHRSAV